MQCLIYLAEEVIALSFDIVASWPALAAAHRYGLSHVPYEGRCGNKERHLLLAHVPDQKKDEIN